MLRQAQFILKLTKRHLKCDVRCENLNFILSPSETLVIFTRDLKTGLVNPRPPTTVNLQATSDNKRKVNGRASRARVRGERLRASAQRFLCSACAQPTALGHKRCINDNVSQLN
jgi:hypothetical protein